jgi:hypothetical protein
MRDNPKTSACNNHEELVSYLYGEVTPEQARGVEAHLTECSRCDEELAAFRRVRSNLQEWELNDMPIVRVALPPQRKSAINVLKELLGVAPVWVKVLGAGAAAMLVLAVMGTDISVSNGEYHFRTHLLGLGGARVQPPPSTTGTQIRDKVEAVSLTRDEIKALVSQQILESERAQKEAMTRELARLEAGLKNTHSNDFAKLAVKVQEQRDQIKILERDIDRRAELDFSDILFSSNGAGRSRRALNGAEDNAEGGQ